MPPLEFAGVSSIRLQKFSTSRRVNNSCYDVDLHITINKVVNGGRLPLHWG